MYQLAWHTSFVRAFKKITKNNAELKQYIIDALEILQENPYNPKLKTHKLNGKLKDYLASVVNYDCRIVFTFTNHPDNDEKIIALIDIGTHDTVY